MRTENVTMLHVNEVNSSVPVGYSLLAHYTSKPWLNPELGIEKYIYFVMVLTHRRQELFKLKCTFFIKNILVYY